MSENNENVELFCTYNPEEDEWEVWFPTMGGRNVLDTFATKEEAWAFWREQVNDKNL